MFFFCFEDCVIPLKQVYAHTKVYWAYSQVVYFGLLKLLRHTHPICDYLLKRLLPILSIFGIYPVFMICKPDISTIPILLYFTLWYVSLAFVIISNYCSYFYESNTLLYCFEYANMKDIISFKWIIHDILYENILKSISVICFLWIILQPIFCTMTTILHYI